MFCKGENTITPLLAPINTEQPAKSSGKTWGDQDLVLNPSSWLFTK